MLETKDVHTLFQRNESNIVLTLPTAAILVSIFFGVPLYIPVELIIPHLIYVAIFIISIITDLIPVLKKT